MKFTAERPDAEGRALNSEPSDAPLLLLAQRRKSLILLISAIRKNAGIAGKWTHGVAGLYDIAATRPSALTRQLTLVRLPSNPPGRKYTSLVWIGATKPLVTLRGTPPLAVVA